MGNFFVDYTLFHILTFTRVTDLMALLNLARSDNIITWNNHDRLIKDQEIMEGL